MTEDVEGQNTADWYDQWHAVLEEHIQVTPTFRKGVLISELLGSDDGPYPARWEERDTD